MTKPKENRSYSAQIHVYQSTNEGVGNRKNRVEIFDEQVTESFILRVLQNINFCEQNFS